MCVCVCMHAHACMHACVCLCISALSCAVVKIHVILKCFTFIIWYNIIPSGLIIQLALNIFECNVISAISNYTFINSIMDVIKSNVPCAGLLVCIKCIFYQSIISSVTA